MLKSKCCICGRKGRRICPAQGETICTACCGTKRGSKISCTSDCQHFPFSTTAYDKWLSVDGSLNRKLFDFVIKYYGKNKFQKIINHMSFEQNGGEEEFAIAAQSAMYYILFVEKDENRRTLVDIWEEQGWKGLNNDEIFMMHYRKGARVTVVEIQKVMDHQALECIDILEPEIKPFTVFDRNMASRANRFDRLLTWLTHYPHFSRIEHGGVELTNFVFKEFIEQLKKDFEDEIQDHLDYTKKDFISANFGKYCSVVFEMARQKKDIVQQKMDLNQCIAIYAIKTSQEKIEKILEKHPDFEWEDQDPREGDPEDTIYYIWLRRGESKKLEKKLHPSFRHDNEELGVGILGNIRLFKDKLEVETFGKQKFEFAMGMIKKYFGSQLKLKNEKIVDLSEKLAEEELEEKDIARKNEIPVQIEEQILKKFYQNHYKKLIDDRIPALGYITPRQAANDSKKRLLLVELMKDHIKNIEKLNKSKGFKISIEWVLDELGLEELK